MESEILPFDQILFIVLFYTGEIVEFYSSLVICFCRTGAAGTKVKLPFVLIRPPVNRKLT